LRDATQEVCDPDVRQGALKKVGAHTGLGVDLRGVVGGELGKKSAPPTWTRKKELYQIGHGLVGGLVDALHELEDVVGVAVND
jgi:hypothetical protein